VCGIAGMVALREGLGPVPQEALSRMAGALRHRGPDASGAYRDPRAGLVHTRLSIVDLQTGDQPLTADDRRLWVVFNGEIFNFVELRAELEAKGHGFHSRSDTEVIVHAWQEWGEGCFERFNGQWALALWDARERELVLSRDRLGVRPLHLCQRGGWLFFATEVKALFAADPSLPRELDPLGLAETFTFWSAVAPRTAFRGVEELEPGHLRRYAGGQVRDREFWRPRFPERGRFAGSLPEAAEAVRSALAEATRLRMTRSDVPVGSYLSGGLDSSLVAALGRTAAGERFRTFSLRFADAEYDETGYQRAMVKLLGSEHHEVLVSRADIAAALPEVIRHSERPILRTAPAPLFLLSKAVREAGIKVVLTGEGADEVFAGYDLFREAKVRRFWARQPGSAWRPRLLERLYPYLARSPVSQPGMARRFFGRDLDEWRSPGFSHAPRWQSTRALTRLFAPGLRNELQGRDSVAELLATLPPDYGRWAPLEQDQYLEMRTLLAGYLLSSQGDRMLMAHSVEGRFPFLDPNVVALASGLPPHFKLRVLDEKHVLKRAAQGLVPQEIVHRPKQPFRAPDAAAFFGPGAPEWLEEVIADRALEEAGVFDPSAVRQLWAKCSRAPAGAPFSNADNMAVVGVLSTQLLHRVLIREPAAPPEVTWTALHGEWGEGR